MERQQGTHTYARRRAHARTHEQINLARPQSSCEGESMTAHEIVTSVSTVSERNISERVLCQTQQPENSDVTRLSDSFYGSKNKQLIK